MANGSGEPQGLLRLTAPATFGRVVILPVLNRFLASWPKLRAEVSLTDRVNDIIDDGYDLAIRIGEPREHGSLIARTLTRQQDVVVASPGYLSTRPPPLHPDDLTDHACLSYLSAGQHRGWRFAIDGRTASIRPRARLSLDGGEALRDAAISGAGLAYLPSYVVDDDVANDRLRTVLSAYAAPPVPICALYPSRRHLASKVRRFIDLVAAEL